MAPRKTSGPGEEWTRPDPQPQWYSEPDRLGLHQRSRKALQIAIDWRNVAPTPADRSMLRSAAIRQRKARFDLHDIFDAVDPGYDQKNRPAIPIHINHRRLREDLNNAFAMFLTKSDMDAVGVAQERSDLLRKVAADARRLDTLLKDEWLGWRLSRLMRAGFYDDAQASIRRLMRASEHEVATGLFDGHPFNRQAMAPIRWLLGVELPRIFEQRFGRRAGAGNRRDPYARRDNGVTDGPFIRFAVAAMTEYHRKDSRFPLRAAPTVKRYLEDARNGVMGRENVRQGKKVRLP